MDNWTEGGFEISGLKWKIVKLEKWVLEFGKKIIIMSLCRSQNDW